MKALWAEDVLRALHADSLGFVVGGTSLRVREAATASFTTKCLPPVG